MKAEAEDILDTQRPVNRKIHIRAEAEAEEARSLQSGTGSGSCLKTAVQEAAEWDREEEASVGGSRVGQGGRRQCRRQQSGTGRKKAV